MARSPSDVSGICWNKYCVLFVKTLSILSTHCGSLHHNVFVLMCCSISHNIFINYSTIWVWWTAYKNLWLQIWVTIPTWGIVLCLLEICCLPRYVHIVLWKRDQWTAGHKNSVSGSRGSFPFDSIHGKNFEHLQLFTS